MQLGHLLTRSGLTYPQVSSKVYHDSFSHLDSTVSLPWVIYFEAFSLHVVSSFSCIPIICPKSVLFLTPLQFVHLFCNLSQVYPAVLLMYFISAAVILLQSKFRCHISSKVGPVYCIAFVLNLCPSVTNNNNRPRSNQHILCTHCCGRSKCL